MLGVISIVGCATITNGPNQKISINTSTGHQVIARINGKKMIIPKKDIPISRTKGASVEVLHKDNPCFGDTRYSIVGKNKVSGVFWINILTSGPLGSTTDAVSGGMWEYNEPSFTIPLILLQNCKPKVPHLDSETSHETKSKDSKVDSKKLDSKIESKADSKNLDSKK